ncbi:unnamed protein product, partial [Onchocerca flexuosa]|uniref:Uncharacterized protein n=1 Tax=Onchocerca flexuosa TaxID=387005 RepID=A0A183I8A1_9BILA
ATATATATAVATAASPPQFLQQPQQQQQQQQQIIQQIQANNCNLNDTTNGYHQDMNESNELDEDSNSHKEVKIEVFSEDENDYDDNGDDNYAVKEIGKIKLENILSRIFSNFPASSDFLFWILKLHKLI